MHTALMYTALWGIMILSASSGTTVLPLIAELQVVCCDAVRSMSHGRTGLKKMSAAKMDQYLRLN